MNSTIKAHEVEIARIEHELESAKERLHQTRVALTGVAVGDVVQGTGRLSGKMFRVTEHSYVGLDGRYKWLSGNPQRADGSFGTAVRNIYDHWVSA